MIEYFDGEAEDNLCPRCGSKMILMENRMYQCDYCCGDPDCEVCS